MRKCLDERCFACPRVAVQQNSQFVRVSLDRILAGLGVEVVNEAQQAFLLSEKETIESLFVTQPVTFKRSVGNTRKSPYSGFPTNDVAVLGRKCHQTWLGM